DEQLALQVGRDGVELLGPVERDGGDALVHLVQDQVVHHAPQADVVPAQDPIPATPRRAAAAATTAPATARGSSAGTNVDTPGPSTTSAWGNAAARRRPVASLKLRSEVPHTTRTGPVKRPRLGAASTRAWRSTWRVKRAMSWRMAGAVRAGSTQLA